MFPDAFPAHSSHHTGSIVWLLCCFSLGSFSNFGDGITFRQLLLSAAVGASIDGDHFLFAGSLSFERAKHLPQRPLTHSLTIAMALSLVSLLLLGRRGMAVGVPYLMHVLRDGLRRGLWLWPLGHTPPLTSTAYLSAAFLAPLFARSMSGSLEKTQTLGEVDVERAA